MEQKKKEKLSVTVTWENWSSEKNFRPTTVKSELGNCSRLFSPSFLRIKSKCFFDTVFRQHFVFLVQRIGNIVAEKSKLQKCNCFSAVVSHIVK
jgi:hypothetical protein